MTDRTYKVVALSIPIVYTLEGDHDPNGMAYALGPVAELLNWAKDRWYDQDALLPRLHVRRQRVHLVVDGLERLDVMLERLKAGNADDQQLLAELIQRESMPELGEEEDRLTEGARRRGGRAAAVRTNVVRQIDEIRIALTDLGDTSGPRDPLADDAEAVRLSRAALEGTDPEDLDPATADKAIKLVTLTSAERLRWMKEWEAQAHLLDTAIERWFETCENDPERRFDTAKLVERALLKSQADADPAIDAAWVKRLILNDHAPGSNKGKPFDRFNPMKPIPALRPLVLRCRKGETVKIEFENSIKGRDVGFHVQGGGLARSNGRKGVKYADGAWIGENERSILPHGGTAKLYYSASTEGVWPINDLGDVRGNEAGTNCHGLFGTIIVEAPGAKWRDPETGADLTNADWCSFLDVDIITEGEDVNDPRHEKYVDFHYDDVPRSFREFTTFIHDQPEVHSGLHTVGEHSIMPLSYRAEPMHNRLPHRMRQYVRDTNARPKLSDPNKVDRRAFRWLLGDEMQELFQTARMGEDTWLEYVAGEEQHHSSWLFGDPITHIQRAYAGDPCRVRLVHAGVKETHIYHLHVHQWRAVAQDTAQPSVNPCYTDGKPDGKGSHLLDSVTIGPQHAMTIDPLYGSGSRQKSVGDIIWHCHLYPHFHHGMWGLWRSYDRYIDGKRPYPDGSYCPPLRPLPGLRPPSVKAELPGFPWFIDGVFPMKSPPPPVGDKTTPNGRRMLLKMPRASVLERNAMPERCRTGETPGAVFVDLDSMAEKWCKDAGLPEKPRILSYDIEVTHKRTQYNVDGWYDPCGHYYRLQKVSVKEWDKQAKDYRETLTQDFVHAASTNPEPLFPRANHGDIVEWRQHNALGSFPADDFDHGQLPVECGLHVHLVKFDPLASDGSSTGWNYLSGASCTEAVGANSVDTDGQAILRNVSRHRWIVDEEFGPCFFHDHLLANFRQKHGLFSAMIAEPFGSQWLKADDQSHIAWGDGEAVIVPPVTAGLLPFREACLGICDFVPLLDKGGRPLNPPSDLSGDDDPGSMAVNYRSAPLTFRGSDPSQWFSSHIRSQSNFAGEQGDPDTPVIRTYPGERIRIRLMQGSHEEQHGFAVHGMRWRRDWGHPKAPLVNQQTLGISECFTLDINPTDASPYGVGDHLWHFCAMDDIWLGCWGLIRSLQPSQANFERFAPLPNLYLSPPDARAALREAANMTGDKPLTGIAPVPLPSDENTRTFVISADRIEHRFAGDALTDPWGLIYRVIAHDEGALSPKLKAALKEAIRKDRWELPDRDDDDDLEVRPLVLRARRGEWVRVILVNNLLEEQSLEEEHGEEDGDIEFGVEPSPARLPLEHMNDMNQPDRRTVSSRVSIHASLLRYDVGRFDGSFAGRNLDSTVGTGITSGPHIGSHMGAEETPGAVVHREDHQRGRNWREYWWYADEQLAPASWQNGPGQVCWLHDMADIRNHRHHGLIGALIVEPGDVEPFAIKSKTIKPNGWHGLDAELRSGGNVVAYESALFVQDGLRLFVNGNPEWPLPDLDPTDDPEDSGNKGINYRSHLIKRGTVSRAESDAFPISTVPAGSTIWLRLLGAGDKPRQHTISVHGCAWDVAPWVANSDRSGAISGLSPGRAETVVIKLEHQGDYAARAGAFRWASEHGVWSSLRAE